MTIESTFENTTSIVDNNTTAVPRLSFIELLNLQSEYKAAKWINNSKFYFMMVLAVLANGAALGTVWKKARKSSVSVYIANLAVWDTLTILIKATYFILTDRKVVLGNVSCKLLTFLPNLAKNVAVWQLVIMGAERLLAVSFPLKVSTWCSVAKARVAISLLILVFILINSQYLVFVEATSAWHGSGCEYSAAYKSYTSQILPWLDMTLYAYGPQLLILVINVAIIISLASAHRRRSALANTRAPTGQGGQGHVTAMLLMIFFVFFFLTTPYSIFYLCMANELWAFRKSVQSYATYLLLTTTLRFLADLNHCVNFFLYVLTGSGFRQDFRKLLQCSNTKRSKSTTSNVYTVNHNSAFISEERI